MMLCGVHWPILLNQALQHIFAVVGGWTSFGVLPQTQHAGKTKFSVAAAMLLLLWVEERLEGRCVVEHFSCVLRRPLHLFENLVIG